jgi:transcriptional regulator with XRE-family HTH domain
MNSLIGKLRNKFQDEDYRHSYAEECLNTMIASQIKILREQQKMTQAKLAEKTGMMQPRLSVLEDANYSNWSINTLKRIARAFDLALTVRFDAFSDVILDFESLSRESMERSSFKEDALFQSAKVTTSRRFNRRNRFSNAAALALVGQRELFAGQVIQITGAPGQESLKSTAAATEAKGNSLSLLATELSQQGATHATRVSAIG